MKIAVRNNDVFINYSERFSDDEIVSEPYNYHIIEISDDIDSKKIVFSDFDIRNNQYIFNLERFSLRTEAEEDNAKLATYKQQIDSLIRAKYSINDEIAILRQRDSKTSEFNEYFEFVENVKQIVQNLT